MTRKGGQSHLPAGTREHTFLIYDASSGEIVHGHKAVFFPGQEPPEAAHLERQALEVAAQVTRRKASSLRALAVDHSKLQHGAHYRVETKTGRLKRVTPKRSA
jgi:hypothetical protein